MEYQRKLSRIQFLRCCCKCRNIKLKMGQTDNATVKTNQNEFKKCTLRERIWLALFLGRVTLGIFGPFNFRICLRRCPPSSSLITTCPEVISLELFGKHRVILQIVRKVKTQEQMAINTFEGEEKYACVWWWGGCQGAGQGVARAYPRNRPLRE